MEACNITLRSFKSYFRDVSYSTEAVLETEGTQSFLVPELLPLSHSKALFDDVNASEPPAIL